MDHDIDNDQEYEYEEFDESLLIEGEVHLLNGDVYCEHHCPSTQCGGEEIDEEMGNEDSPHIIDSRFINEICFYCSVD
jgi:hypothetical protein